MRAELRGIVVGMKLAWDKRIRKLRIQIDSKAAADMLLEPGSRNNKHIYREANFAADYLANLGQSLPLGVHVLDVPNSVLADWFRFDLVGSCTPRLIINNM
ncbi:Putative ribonuclease H protein At1g65750 [Linum perenne]